ncbi:hypothetical protein EYR36_010427 [Pleurotus pulmonarius]|nr:hypothetical protein EYR36_010427 [Pleurotus pulmonarius]
MPYATVYVASSLSDHSSDEYSSDHYSDSSTGAGGTWKADAALAKHLLGQPIGDVSIEDFVKHVYGFTDDDVKYINDVNVWTLHPSGLKEYDTGLSEGRPEKELFVPFKIILDDLFKKFTNDGYKLNLNLVSGGDDQWKNTGAPCTPDGIFFFEPFDDKDDKLSWSLSKAFLEFAVTPQDQMIETNAAVHEGTTDSSALPTSPSSKRRNSDVLELEGQGPSKRLKRSVGQLVS